MGSISGLSWVVRRTICCTCLANICGLRPGRGASYLDTRQSPGQERARHGLSQFARHFQLGSDLQVWYSFGGQQHHFGALANRTVALRARACFSSLLSLFTGKFDFRCYSASYLSWKVYTYWLSFSLFVYL